MSVSLFQEDYVGKRYGRLTVLNVELKRAGSRNRTFFFCKCDCGNEKWIKANDIKNGRIQSCGCYRQETGKVLGQTAYTAHGMARTRLYKIWNGMKTRCNPNYEQHRYYSERGVAVCKEWRSFEPFRDWALANGYSDDLTIDRKENDKGYSPDNCRWVTATVQMRNRDAAINNTSGQKGVGWDSKNRKWIARIMVGRKSIHLGRYENVVDAIVARERAEMQYWGNER